MKVGRDADDAGRDIWVSEYKINGRSGSRDGGCGCIEEIVRNGPVPGEAAEDVRVEV